MQIHKTHKIETFRDPVDAFNQSDFHSGEKKKRIRATSQKRPECISALHASDHQGRRVQQCKHEYKCRVEALLKWGKQKEEEELEVKTGRINVSSPAL